MRDNTKTQPNQYGMTLIEIMIAMVLGLMAVGGLMTLFVQNKQSFNQDELISRMNDDARFALSELRRDISMAGFYADLLNPNGIVLQSTNAITADCGLAADTDWMITPADTGTGDHSSLTAVDNATATTAPATFKCITGSNIVAGTDVVGIKRLQGQQSAALASNTFYVRTNGTAALMFNGAFPGTPDEIINAPFNDWAYVPNIYYIRNFAQTAGDGIPTLCRKIIDTSGTPTMGDDCIAEGIENLQIQYGLDTNGDGNPNAYVNGPTAAQMQIAVVARISILARSVDADPRYNNGQTYVLGNSANYTPADSFYRRVYTTTVQIRNLKSLRRLRS